MLDTLFPPHILLPDIDNNLLGQAVFKALKKGLRKQNRQKQ
ncbi:hypothetical protein ACG2K1_04520 [Neisseria sp. 23W00296]